MIRLWFVLFLMAASPVFAQVATVRSGEHDVFSRIVVEAPTAVDWQFGRTDDGYELSLGAVPWRFDLAGVFDRIPRNRLAGLWADPETGHLQFGIGCACHAVPFEFRPGIIVIDLKDGPPPKGSSFETALNGGVQPALDARPIAKPRARPWGLLGGYDWVSVRNKPQGALRATLAPSQKLDAAEMVPLRDALLAQLSRGMAEGVVEMATPGPRPALVDGVSSGSQMRVAVGDLPGLSVGGDRTADGVLQAGGATCTTDADLALWDWGLDGPVSETLAQARAGLLTEFDTVDPEAVKRGARQLINLGFGAEAGQLLAAFPLSADDPSAAILASLTRLIDGNTDPAGPFPAMAVCDSAAALWAALATETPLASPPLRTDAMTRGFSALPPHLRIHLGPVLVERLMQAGNKSGVQAIREAIERAPGDTAPDVAVMEAKISLANERPALAESQAQNLLTQAGPAVAEATLALVSAQVAQSKPVAAETVTTLLALLAENEGTEIALDLRQALVLAKVAAGDVAGGFAMLPEAPAAGAEAWRLLAVLGSDSDLLAQAVRPAAEPRPDTLPATALQIAKRLIGLGFPDAALAWLDPSTPDAAAEQRLLLAEAELQRQDARASLQSLAGISAPEAARLRARALIQLGDPGAAALAWAEAGDANAQERAQVWTQDWKNLALDGPEAWRAAATVAAKRPQPASAIGPLARTAALLVASQTDRATLTALLAEVPGPADVAAAP